MKIFYAVQATGNGHIARAVELMPYLQQYGEVDIFLSGNNSSLAIDIPVRYKSKGISLQYTKKGSLNYFKMMKEFNALRVLKEARELPVENYDCVIIDFESIAALSCMLKKIPCIGFGHQASFQSDNCPRPWQKSLRGEFVLKRYAPCTTYIGLHFNNYDSFIFNPILKKEIINAQPDNKNHITVYLPHYTDEILIQHFHKVDDMEFHLFSKKATLISKEKNVTILPVDNAAFNKSVINCNGVITGAGFETPAEVLYLQKKLMCLPIKGQYEQMCNATALKRFDVAIVENINEEDFADKIKSWLRHALPQPITLKHSTEQIVEHLIHEAKNLK